MHSCHILPHAKVEHLLPQSWALRCVRQCPCTYVATGASSLHALSAGVRSADKQLSGVQAADKAKDALPDPPQTGSAPASAKKEEAQTQSNSNPLDAIKKAAPASLPSPAKVSKTALKAPTHELLLALPVLTPHDHLVCSCSNAVVAAVPNCRACWWLQHPVDEGPCRAVPCLA